MAIFRRYFAPARDLALVLVACAFPIFAWSIVRILWDVPAWVLQFGIWDLIGLIAYTETYALLETVLVFLALTLLGAVLPARFLRDSFVARAGTVALWTSGVTAVFHIFWQSTIEVHAALWLAGFLVSLSVWYVLLIRYEKLEALMRSVIERLTVVSSVYMAVGVLSVIIVVVRNI